MAGYMTGFISAYDNAERLRLAKEAQDHQMALDLADQMFRKHTQDLSEQRFQAEQDPNSPDNQYRAALTDEVRQRTGLMPQETARRANLEDNATVRDLLNQGYSLEAARLVAEEGWNSPKLAAALVRQQLPQYQQAVQETQQAALPFAAPATAGAVANFFLPAVGNSLQEAISNTLAPPSLRDVALLQEAPNLAPPTPESVMAQAAPKYQAGREDAIARREAVIRAQQLREQQLQVNADIAREKLQAQREHQQAAEKADAESRQALQAWRQAKAARETYALQLRSRAVTANEQNALRRMDVQLAQRARTSASQLDTTVRGLEKRLMETKQKLQAQQAIADTPISPIAMQGPQYQQYVNAQSRAKALVPELQDQAAALQQQVNDLKRTRAEMNTAAFEKGGSAANAAGLPDARAQKKLLDAQRGALERANDQEAAMARVRALFGKKK